MPFENLGFEVPDGLTYPDVVLRPIVAADAELDHAAVMESKDYLRPWEQTGWPADDFTVAANREDLAGLERRHGDNEAYTYTVMNPAGTECLGCVYLMPTNARSFARTSIMPLGDDRWEDYETTVYFWVRKSRLAEELDRTLLEALRAWLARDWSFRGHLVVTNERFTQQVDLIERAGLQRRFTIEESGKSPYLAYGEPRPAGGRSQDG